jgi:hypothetical protein
MGNERGYCADGGYRSANKPESPAQRTHSTIAVCAIFGFRIGVHSILSSHYFGGEGIIDAVHLRIPFLCHDILYAAITWVAPASSDRIASLSMIEAPAL